MGDVQRRTFQATLYDDIKRPAGQWPEAQKFTMLRHPGRTLGGPCSVAFELTFTSHVSTKECKMIRIEWAANCRDAVGRRCSVRVTSIDGMIALTLPHGEIAYFTTAQARQLHTAIRKATNTRKYGKTSGAGIPFPARAGTDAAGRHSGVSSPRVLSVAARHPSRGEAGLARVPGLTASQPQRRD